MGRRCIPPAVTASRRCAAGQACASTVARDMGIRQKLYSTPLQSFYPLPAVTALLITAASLH